MDVALVMEKHGFTERRACELLGVERSSYRYEARPDGRAEIAGMLQEAAWEKRKRTANPY